MLPRALRSAVYFFQAEDGIRDVAVTGVQTCALPICEERFRKIFDHSNDAIFVIDPERDRFLDVNSKAGDLLGYSRDEILSLPKTALHGGETPESLAFVRSVFENGSGWTGKLSFITKAGAGLATETP